MLELWQKAHSEEVDTDYIPAEIKSQGFFLPDGIIDEAQYQKAPERILFIAKEANWFSPGGSVEENTEHTNNIMFWHREVAFCNKDNLPFSQRLIMLTNALLTGSYDNTKYKEDRKMLRHIAVINLNKRGGFPGCVFKTLAEYVQRYQNFIRKEIELINPTMIVCCSHDVQWLLDKYKVVPKQIKVIAIYHPSYPFISDAEYLRQLQCAVNGEKWQRKK